MLSLLVLNLLWIVGFSTLLTWEHSIFRVMREREEYPIWAKPLFACWPCMSSVHGLPVALWVYGLSPLVLVHVICLHGLAVMASVIIASYHD